MGTSFLNAKKVSSQPSAYKIVCLCCFIFSGGVFASHLSRQKRNKLRQYLTFTRDLQMPIAEKCIFTGKPAGTSAISCTSD